MCPPVIRDPGRNGIGNLGVRSMTGFCAPANLPAGSTFRFRIDTRIPEFQGCHAKVDSSTKSGSGRTHPKIQTGSEEQFPRWPPAQSQARDTSFCFTASDLRKLFELPTSPAC
jgi:hypothetical protein